jgi:hypothetical protein
VVAQDIWLVAVKVLRVYVTTVINLGISKKTAQKRLVVTNVEAQSI